MPSGTLISVEQYLATSYRPDCDYVEGRIEERNLGEWDHSKLQAAIIAYFYQRRKTWNISVAPEQRVQVKPTRFPGRLYRSRRTRRSGIPAAPFRLHRDSFQRRPHERNERAH